MTKHAIRKPSNILLLLAISVATSGLHTVAVAGDDGGPSSYAESEIIRRQQAIQEAIEAEAKGDRLRADDDYQGAVDKYNEALSKLGNPSPMNESVRGRIVIKFCQVSVLRSRELGKRGEFQLAKTLLNNVLSDNIDPDYEPARRLLKQLDDPEYFNQAATPQHADNVEEVNYHFKLGLGYFDLAQWDEAIEEFNKVLAIDPYNVAARRQMERVQREMANYSLASRDYTRGKMLGDVDRLWDTPVPGTASISVVGPPIEEDDGTGAIMSKLKNITLESFSFENANIEDVVTYLKAVSERQDLIEADPAKKGVNFILQTNQARPATPITLNLKGIPLIVAIEQTCQLAGMRYRIEPHAVIISPLGSGGGTLTTRTFSVPPGFLVAGSAGGGSTDAPADDPFGSGSSTPQGGIRGGRPDTKKILESMGVDFSAAGSTATSNPGTGRITVKNTMQQLDLIQALIDDYRKGAGVNKQVHITTKFVEVTQRNTDELGFDWLLGGFNIGASGLFGSGGTMGNAGVLNSVNYPLLAPTGVSGGSPVPIGANPITGGNRFGSNAISGNAIDSLLARQGGVTSATNVSPGAFALAGVFTDPQFQVVMRMLSQKKGVDLLTAPSVVTRPGNRATIQVIREFPWPTDFEAPVIPQQVGAQVNGLGGGGGGGGGGVAGNPAQVASFPVTPTTPTAFEFRNTGVSMEVDPTVGEDGYSIDLTLAPEVVEFEGFINYGSPILAGAIDGLGRPTTVVLTENRIEQPVFAVRKLQTAVTIWDGQTVGIGGLIREDVQNTEDKLPLLGDIPLIGRLFRTKAEEHFKKNLMIYVTAILIDPAGMRIHPPGAKGSSSEETGAIGPTATGLIPQMPEGLK